MKIVFFGSDMFAVPSLEKLLNSNTEVLSVVTQTDKKRGRHLQLGFSAVKELALKNNLKTFQPETLKDTSLIKSLNDIKPDLFVVAAYGKIIPKEILAIPKIFSINIHASLLPKYRGAAPINWALINGEKETGVTIIKMNEFMDSGEIILQESLKIAEEDDAKSLREKLSLLASRLILKAIDLIKSNNYSLTAQDEKNVSFAPKLKKSDGLINWNDSAEKIHNKVRGLMPWPGSFTKFRGKILKIHQAGILPLNEKNTTPGEVVQILPDAIAVATAKDAILLKSIQFESSKKINAKEFISGYKIKISEKFG